LAFGLQISSSTTVTTLPRRQTVRSTMIIMGREMDVLSPLSVSVLAEFACLGEILVGHRMLLGCFNQCVESYLMYLWSNLGDRTSGTLFFPGSVLGF
jgi:hypothetical protein